MYSFHIVLFIHYIICSLKYIIKSLNKTVNVIAAHAANGRLLEQVDECVDGNVKPVLGFVLGDDNRCLFERNGRDSTVDFKFRIRESDICHDLFKPLIAIHYRDILFRAP